MALKTLMAHGDQKEKYNNYNNGYTPNSSDTDYFLLMQSNKKEKQ